MRKPDVIRDASVCQNAHAFMDPDVQTRQDVIKKGFVDCPLMEPCFSGQLEGQKIKCSALLGQVIARRVALNGSNIDRETNDLRRAPIFPPDSTGFIDPYSDDPHRTVVDKEEAVKMVQDWAQTILEGPRFEESGTDDNTTPPQEQPYSNTPELTDHFRRLKEANETDVVYQRGVPTRVPRKVCRCPVLTAEDFCPLHGG